MCDTAGRDAQLAVRPRWKRLYGITLPPLAALVVVEGTVPPSAARTLVRCVLVASALLGMAVWVRASRLALDLAPWCACAGETLTIRVIASVAPAAPISGTPASEPSLEHADTDYEVVQR